MTKRMLSLLLALVMTLSLCVPALAADEFAAEAVTEVEEQAPEAPEAPVEPEAEEPAEEPVVEAEAPEAAAILTDEPSAIAGIDVTEANVEALVEAVKNAEKYEDGVLDGTYHGAGYITYDGTGVILRVGNHGQGEIKGLTIDETPLGCCGEYVFWLARARYAIDQLEDAAGSLRDSDVVNITKSLNAATASLTTAVGNDCVVKGSGATHGFAYESYFWSFTNKTNPNGLWAYEEDYPGEFAKARVPSDWVKTYEAWLEKLQDGDFKDRYHADYLEDLTAVVYDVLQYLKENKNNTKTFNELSHKELYDLVASTDAVAFGGSAEVAARTPDHAEASELKDLIVQANDLLKDDYSEDSEQALKDLLDNSTSYWNKVATATTPGFWKDSAMSNLMEYITLKELNDAISVLKAQIAKLQPNYNAARIHEVYLVDASSDPDNHMPELRIYFNKTLSNNGVDDNHRYIVKVECNGYEITAGKYSGGGANWDTYMDKDVVDSAAAASTITWEWAFADLTKFDKDWKTIKDIPMFTTFTVTLYSYDKYGTPETSPLTKIDESIISVNQGGDAQNNIAPVLDKPVIREAGYIIDGNEANAQLGVEDNFKDNDVFYVKLNLPGKNGSVTYPDYGKVKIELVDPNGNSVTLINDSANETYFWWALSDYSFKTQNSVNGKFSGLDIVPGTWTFNLYVQDVSNLTGGREGYPTTPDSTKTITVPGITSYAKYDTLLSNIEKLSKYESMVATHDAIVHQKATTASAREHAALLLTEVKKITDVASTLVNCKENRKAVDQMNTELGRGLAELTDMADYTALNALITLAQGLSSSDYTAMSWRYFQDKDPIKTAQAVVTAGWGKDNQMVVDRAVRSLQYAINALVVAEGKISKAALEAAIIAAKALKEEDYTAESWAAADLKTAIAAAQKVYDKPNATQAEVDKAVVDLNAAVALLVEVTPPEPEGPKAPASGTGWTYYDGEWYFFKNGSLVSNYWVGYVDGASQWANNWYYVGADGKMLTGFQYLDDLKGGKAWYMLQNTPKDGEIGKMLTGYQWTYTSAGEGYFSPKYGSQGACTWTEAWGSYKASTGLWGDGLAHKG